VYFLLDHHQHFSSPAAQALSRILRRELRGRELWVYPVPGTRSSFPRLVLFPRCDHFYMLRCHRLTLFRVAYPLSTMILSGSSLQFSATLSSAGSNCCVSLQSVVTPIPTMIRDCASVVIWTL
jgi:hypothetical protein